MIQTIKYIPTIICLLLSLHSNGQQVQTDPSTGNQRWTVKGVEFTMISVPGGSFTMGKEDDSYNAYYSENDSKPVHRVTLSSFHIGQTEVTQALWQAVMGKNPSSFKGDLDLPVENVSWNDCQKFISKLNRITGASSRLPSEEEWVFAARSGNLDSQMEYSGSNNIGGVAWYRDNSDYRTHRVATKAPNFIGVYDMSGNVWEWCQDQVESDRVTCGGCWAAKDFLCALSDSRHISPKQKLKFQGLRLAL